jgi:hypothetical protein
LKRLRQGKQGTDKYHRRPNFKTPSFGFGLPAQPTVLIMRRPLVYFIFYKNGDKNYNGCVVSVGRTVLVSIYVALALGSHAQARLTMTESNHRFFIRVCATHTRGPAHSDDKDSCSLKRVFFVLRAHLCLGKKN